MNGIVFAADLHLERRAWVSAPLIWGDSYFALRQIRDLCTSHNFGLLLGGDLNDTPRPEPRTVKEILDFLDSFQEQNLPVLFIRGQHDGNDDIPWFSLHRHAVHLHRRTVSLAVGSRQVSCYGIDWTKIDEVNKAINDVPTGTDLLLMHQVWTDFMGENIGGECYFKEVQNCRYLLTGDYHRTIQKTVSGKSGPFTVLSSGSMCMQSIDEPDSKFVFLLTPGHDGQFNIDQIQLKSRKVHRFAISSSDDLDRAVAVVKSDQILDTREGIPDEIRLPIVHIRIPKYGSGPARQLNEYQVVSKALGKRGHLFVSLLDQESSRSVVSKAAVSVTVTSAVVAEVDSCCFDSPQTKKIAESLLASTDPAVELLAQEKRFLEGEEQACASIESSLKTSASIDLSTST